MKKLSFNFKKKDKQSDLKMNTSSFKKSKNRKKIYIGVSVVTAAAVAGGVFYVRGKNTQVKADDSSTSDVQETTATTGTVSNSITGTGTLESADGDAITIPSGLTITEVEVSEGDTVSAGDVLAKVDHSSILTAMDSVQSSIDEVDAEIAAITDETATEDITAGVSGTVTAVYASEDTSVEDTMSASGALVEIAVGGDTDNIIQVTATDGTVTEIDVAVGDEVETGDTLLTVEIDENSEEYNSLITEREELTAELQELVALSETDEITATEDGTIASVNVTASSSSDSSTSSTGSTNVTTSYTTSGSDTTGSTTSSNTVSAVLANYVTAVTAVDSSSSDSDTESTDDTETSDSDTAVAVLTDDTTDTDDTSDTTSSSTEEDATTDSSTEDTQIYFEVSAASSSDDAENAFVLTAPVTGANPVTELEAADGSWTAEITWRDSDGTVLSSTDTFEADTTYIASVVMTAADGYCFGEDSISNLDDISGYTIASNDPDLETDGTLTFTLTALPTAEDTETESTSSSSEDTTDTSTSGSGSSTTGSGSTTSGSTSGGSSSGSSSSGSSSGSSSSGSSSGSSSSSSSSTATTTSDTESTDSSSSSSSSSDSTEVTAFTMESEDTMTMSVSVDELDINSVEVGQTATVTMDALEDVTLEGTVESVSNSASSSGSGSAKYTVEISVPKQDGMLIGMSASATIVVEESENVVTLPVDALQENGNETYVYTSVDEDGNLSGEVTVETGLSDGDTVEITSGLEDGDTVYYEKTGNTSSSGSSDMASGDTSGTMPSGGGEMPSGDMPSGGGDTSGTGGGAPSGGAPSGS